LYVNGTFSRSVDFIKIRSETYALTETRGQSDWVKMWLHVFAK